MDPVAACSTERSSLSRFILSAVDHTGRISGPLCGFLLCCSAAALLLRLLCCCCSGVKVNILSMCWCLNAGQHAQTALAQGLFTLYNAPKGRRGQGREAEWVSWDMYVCLGYVVICYCACPHVLGAINLAPASAPAPSLAPAPAPTLAPAPALMRLISSVGCPRSPICTYHPRTCSTDRRSYHRSWGTRCLLLLLHLLLHLLLLLSCCRLCCWRQCQAHNDSPGRWTCCLRCCCCLH